MKFHRLGVTTTAAVMATLALAACGNDDPTGTSDDAGAGGSLSGQLTASGASSQESAMSAWIAGYQADQPDVTVQYDSVGSGAGRENLLAGAVDFAGSDAALDEEERTKVTSVCGPEGAINIPVYISPVALPFNIKGVDSLQLKADTIAKIFDRKITTWNDPAIAASNPGVTLPATKITPVNRSDESGTTENFMEYLTAAAPTSWSYEADKAWPVAGGEAAAQTSGVVEVVGSTDGAIGYADASAVGDLKSVKVGVGSEYVEFSPEAAAKVVDASTPEETGVEGDLALEVARDTTESGAYPIVLVSYHIVCSRYEDAAAADLVKDFVGYVVSDEGQQASAEAAGSAPISADLRTKAEASLALVTAGS
ncbi:MAG: phosphate ABC transporter substrate-binding protein PstS [Dermatophilaceae bacterium]